MNGDRKRGRSALLAIIEELKKDIEYNKSAINKSECKRSRQEAQQRLKAQTRRLDNLMIELDCTKERIAESHNPQNDQATLSRVVQRALLETRWSLAAGGKGRYLPGGGVELETTLGEWEVWFCAEEKRLRILLSCADDAVLFTITTYGAFAGHGRAKVNLNNEAQPTVLMSTENDRGLYEAVEKALLFTGAFRTVNVQQG